LNLKKKLLVIALIIVLASVSLVAADEAGVITFNIFNSSDSQVNVNVSNSTVQGQTNYTNSQAMENISLTNSTLTINVNGQNITISSQDGNLIVSPPNQTSVLNSNQRPLLSVSFLHSESPPKHQIFAGNDSIEYDFNVTVGVPTSMNYPFGMNATHLEINQAMLSLVDKYNLVTHAYNNELNGNLTSAMWVNEAIVDGMNTFSLFSHDQLNSTQIEAFTNDLYNAFTDAMNGTQ
jgi:hypothetical protein